MKIYGGENPESPRMKIHGGEITEIKGDALNEMTVGGCPKRKGQWGDAPNVNDSGGMPQT